MQKSLLAKNLAFNKNPQSLPNQADIYIILPTHFDQVS